MAIGITVMLFQQYFRAKPVECSDPINLNGTATGVELVRAMRRVSEQGKLSKYELYIFLGKPYCTSWAGDVWLLAPEGTLYVRYQNELVQELGIKSANDK